ncbi:MAG: hypothetical protein ACKV2V_09410 [Blastocatellia bacterium]
MVACVHLLSPFRLFVCFSLCACSVRQSVFFSLSILFSLVNAPRARHFHHPDRKKIIFLASFICQFTVARDLQSGKTRKVYVCSTPSANSVATTVNYFWRFMKLAEKNAGISRYFEDFFHEERAKSGER